MQTTHSLCRTCAVRKNVAPKLAVIRSLYYIQCAMKREQEMETQREQNTQLMKQMDCVFLSAESSLEQIWRHFYTLAHLFAKSQDLASSLNCFIDVFLIRGNEMHNPDKDWLDFFRRQFAMYLMGKRRITCSLSEGDMIHDFLKMEYEMLKEELEESELPFSRENLSQWFASIELDFPWLVGDFEPKWSVG